MKFGADLFDGVIGAVGPGAVGEQSDRELAGWIDPERSAGVTKVSVGLRRTIFSRLRWSRRSVPAEGAGCATGRAFVASKEGNSFWAKDGIASGEQGVGVFGEVLGCGEKSGVGGYAAQNESIFILDFTLDDFLAEGAAGADAWLRKRF